MAERLRALGAAELLAARRADLRGSVRFLFQPDEEALVHGARAMAAWALGMLR